MLVDYIPQKFKKHVELRNRIVQFIRDRQESDMETSEGNIKHEFNLERDTFKRMMNEIQRIFPNVLMYKKENDRRINYYKLDDRKALEHILPLMKLVCDHFPDDIHPLILMLFADIIHQINSMPEEKTEIFFSTFQELLPATFTYVYHQLIDMDILKSLPSNTNQTNKK